MNSQQRDRPAPDPRAQPHADDDHLGVWVAICPLYGWDHAAVYNDPMMYVNCPHCWRFWGDERACEIRHYEADAQTGIQSPDASGQERTP
jgi:hypothetical protein